MIEIVSLIDPLVSLVETILTISDFTQVFPLTVIELALEELHAENTEDNEKGTTYENDISNLF